MKKKVCKSLLVSLFVVSLFQSNVYAVEKAEDFSALAELSIEELLDLKLDTGSFLDLDLTKSPVSMTIIDRSKIRDSGARKLSELLEIYVPGFQYMYNKWNGDIWGLRGIAVDRNTKIIFLINGLKVNNESRDGAFSEINIGLMGDIERVEVLRGPSGLVYGSGSIGGVVNVVTRTPQNLTGDLSYSYGSWNSSIYEGLSNTKIGKDQFLTFSFGMRNSDGIPTGESRIFGNPSWPTPGAPSASGSYPSSGNAWATPGNLKLGVDWRSDNFRLYSRFTRQRTPAGQFFIVDPWPEVEGTPDKTAAEKKVDGKTIDYTNPLANVESGGNNRREYVSDNFLINGTYDRNIFDTDKISLSAAIIGATNRIQTLYNPLFQTTDNERRANFIDESFGERRFFLSGRYLMKRVEHLQSAFGFEARYDNLGKDLEGIDISGGTTLKPAISQVDYTNFALYTENYYTLGDFGFDLGLRVDKHTRTDFFFSPKFAVIYTPVKDHSIKAFVQGSSNNGTPDNYEFNRFQFQDDGSVSSKPFLPDATQKNVTPGVTAEQLRALKPEKIISYEIASSHNFDNVFTLSPSISYNSVSDLFVWQQNILRVVNGAPFNFVTAEADTQYQKDGLIIGASHAIQKVVNTNPDTTVSFTRPKTIVPADPADPNKYVMQIVEGETETLTSKPIKEQTSYDGSSFLNFASHVSKLYLTYHPNFDFLNFVTFHTNLRVFWGLDGRTEFYKDDIAKGYNFLGITNTPMVKWNVSLQFKLPYDYVLSCYGYDLLGASDNLNGARWEQTFSPDAKDLFTTDQRAFAVKLEKQF